MHKLVSATRNLPAHDAARMCSVVDVLRTRAERQPGDIAYRWLRDGEDLDAELSYEELDRRARSIAVFLKQWAKPGDRALLLYPPGLEFVAAFFGCLYAGVINVPAYPPQLGRRSQTVDRLRSIARETAPLVLTSTKLLATKQLVVDAAPELGTVHWLTTGDAAADLADDWAQPDIAGSTPALLQFSSGSTAMPRGSIVSHHNLMSNLEVIRRCFSHDRASRGVIWLPPYHDMGLIGGVLQPVFAGFPVVLMSPVSVLQHPIRWLKAISRFGATTSGGPNFAYELCVRRIKPEQRRDLDLSQWKIAFNGAEPVRPETLDRFSSTFADCGFRREAFYPCYGLAEATLMVAGGRPRRPPVIERFARSALSQGRVRTVAENHPLGDVLQLASSGPCAPGHRIAIVDPDSRLECPEDRVGEIWVSGPSVTQGYWGREAETLESHHAHMVGTADGPFLRTGDLGFVKGGELFVTGRLKDLIIINGRNYYPQDLELTVEQSHPSFRPNGCAVFSVEVGNQERVIVWVEAAMEPDRMAGIRHLVRRNVAEAHDLQVYDVRFLAPGSLPKTTSGKIQRHRCKEIFARERIKAEI